MSGIIRVKKDKRYFVASNEPFNDERLSWEARGVMGYLLSKPDDWIARNTDLVKRGPAGSKKMERILKELKEHGYMRRYRYRDENGTFEWVTEIYESPSLNPDFGSKSTIPPKSGYGEGNRTGSTIPPKSSSGSSSSGSSSSGSSSSGSGGDIVSTDLPSTDIPNTEVVITERENPAPTIASAIKIYLQATKIKKVENIPEAVVEWLKEQEQYMDVAYHPEALRQAIVEADKSGEKLIFDVDTLEMSFTENIPDVKGVSYKYYSGRPEAENFAIEHVDLTNDERVPFEDLPGWLQEKAIKQVTADIKAKHGQQEEPETNSRPPASQAPEAPPAARPLPAPQANGNGNHGPALSAMTQGPQANGGPGPDGWYR